MPSPEKLDKAAVDEILETLQLPPSLRAEQLPPETILALAETVRRKNLGPTVDLVARM